MISVKEAKSLIAEQIKEMPVERVSLAMATGRILCSSVYASQDIPAFAQSSMDGYAIRFEDHGQPLTIIGEMQAGTAQQLKISAGQAARIFTGAPLPEGADTVVMQEKVSVENGVLTILDPALSSGLYVRNKGAEAKSGDLAISAGSLLSPAAIGFLAGIGETEVDINTCPTAGIIVTGKELQQPGHPLSPGQVYESNSYSLTAALRQSGLQHINFYYADDDLGQLTHVLKSAFAENTVVLLTGGVSVGDYDFVVRAAELSGVKQVFHKVKQKPGKPLYFGIKADKLIFGLPGNPSSVLSCFYQYVLPALEKLSNKKSSVKVQEAILTHPYSKPAGLTHFLKAHFEDGKVTPLTAQESFRMSSFAQANCMLELEEDKTDFAAGTSLKIYLLPE